MFKRKRPPGPIKRMMMVLWPDSGFKRAGKYILHRVARLQDTPHNIAIGLACGVAVSLTPLLGLHFTLAAIFAWILGGNILASAIGTFFGSPWTFPFIWYFTFKFGNFILGMNPAELPQKLSLGLLMDRPDQVLYPMLAGSIPAAIVFGLLTFFPARWAITKYQDLRSRKRLQNSHKKPKTVTGKMTGWPQKKSANI